MEFAGYIRSLILTSLAITYGGFKRCNERELFLACSLYVVSQGLSVETRDSETDAYGIDDDNSYYYLRPSLINVGVFEAPNRAISALSISDLLGGM